MIFHAESVSVTLSHRDGAEDTILKLEIEVEEPEDRFRYLDQALGSDPLNASKSAWTRIFH
jgi:hypothetical protein